MLKVHVSNNRVVKVWFKHSVTKKGRPYTNCNLEILDDAGTREGFISQKVIKAKEDSNNLANARFFSFEKVMRSVHDYFNMLTKEDRKLIWTAFFTHVRTTFSPK